MLYLLFKLGNDRYAIRTDHVVEILPLVNWKAIPPAPSGVAGVFNYHGSPVPLIDISELATQRPSQIRMSTRIVLVNYVPSLHQNEGADNGETHLLGLLAEEATSTLRRTEDEFGEPGVAVKDAAYLGPVTTDDDEIVQRVEIDQLLPESVQELLFRQPLDAFIDG